jgi:hypothetical protein
MGKAMTSTNHPAPESEREAVAQIIDPDAFIVPKHPASDDEFWRGQRKQTAFTKADAILSRRGEPVAWLYESWLGGDSWGKHFSFEKPAGNKWQRNIEPLYASPPAAQSAVRERTIEVLEEIMSIGGGASHWATAEKIYDSRCRIVDLASAAFAQTGVKR